MTGRLLCASLLVAFGVFGATQAQSAMMVVVEARGIALKPGQMIDDGTPLLLKAGQHVSLIASNGVTLKLDGPFSDSPASAAAGGGDKLKVAVQGFLTQTTPRQQEEGTTRAGQSVALPDPWLVDVNRKGSVCLRQGEKPLFWRESAATEATLSVMPGDRSWKAEAVWRAGVDRLVVARDIPIRDGSSYIVTLNGDAVAITARVVPTALLSDPMRAAWMAHMGCRAQAEALARSLH